MIAYDYLFRVSRDRLRVGDAARVSDSRETALDGSGSDGHGGMSPLEVAVDARVVATDTRGIGRYERAILRRLLASDELRFTLLVPGVLPALARGKLSRALGTNRFALASGVPKNADVVWHPANGTFFPSTKPSIATIHDAVPFRYPNTDTQLRENEQGPFRVSVATAKRFIAVSEFGKREIEEVFRISGDRIEVIYHGVDSAFSPGDPESLPHGLAPGSYFLFVGAAQGEPRKNFALLYEAYTRAWPRRTDRRSSSPARRRRRFHASSEPVRSATICMVAQIRPCARSIAERSRSSSRRITKRSACRSSKRWPVARPWSHRRRVVCPRSVVPQPSMRRPKMRMRGRTPSAKSPPTQRCVRGCAKPDSNARALSNGSAAPARITNSSSR